MANISELTMPSPFICLEDVHATTQRWFWPNRIPVGALTVFEGDPGCNKSTITYDLAARLTSGRSSPLCRGSKIPAGVVLLQAEDDPASTIRPNLEAMGADLSKIVVHNPEHSDPITLPSGIDHIRKSVALVNARLIVVDPISAYSACNLSSDQSARKALGPLMQLAKEMNAAVILVRHFTKGSRGQNSLYQGAGSIGIIGLARSALQVIDDPNNAGCRLLVHTKCSVGPKAKTIRFRPQQINGRLGIEWIERVDFPLNNGGHADSLVNSPALEEAVDYLSTFVPGRPDGRKNGNGECLWSRG